jgi:hypothetical protein
MWMKYVFGDITLSLSLSIILPCIICEVIEIAVTTEAVKIGRNSQVIRVKVKTNIHPHETTWCCGIRPKEFVQ